MHASCHCCGRKYKELWRFIQRANVAYVSVLSGIPRNPQDNTHLAAVMDFRADFLPIEGGGVLDVMHGCSRMTMDPRIPTMPARSTSVFHRLGQIFACTKREFDSLLLDLVLIPFRNFCGGPALLFCLSAFFVFCFRFFCFLSCSAFFCFFFVGFDPLFLLLGPCCSVPCLRPAGIFAREPCRASRLEAGERPPHKRRRCQDSRLWRRAHLRRGLFVSPTGVGVEVVVRARVGVGVGVMVGARAEAKVGIRVGVLVGACVWTGV